MIFTSCKKVILQMIVIDFWEEVAATCLINSKNTF
jgi:hypothetical protein